MGQDDYHELDGVADGLAASAASLRMINPETTGEVRQQLRQELLAYCRLDVVAMRDIIEALASRIASAVTPATEPALAL